MFKLFFSKDESSLGIRERLIRKISFFGLIITLIPCVEAFIVESSIATLFPLIGLIIMLIIAQVLSYKYKKHEAAAIIIGIAAVLCAFPSIFFLSGGISGGATVYFVLGIFYWIGMFKGIQRILFTSMTIVVDFICYYIGYKYPVLITQLDTPLEVYGDSFLAIVLVGILLGIVTTFQIGAYEKERKLALEQKDEIEKFSDSKNDFFASMSHEIRTPINAVIGLDEMILREESLPEEVLNDAITIQSASKMLLSLVNDIMDFSKIEGHKMEISPIEYGTESLFVDLIDMIRLRVEDKDLELKVNIDKDMPRVLYGDDKRIKQVILNLLTNAVKYTKQGSVTLEAHVDKLDEYRCNLIVSVSDTGVGIKSEHLSSLFDTFSRVKNTDNRTIEGTGLGLSISKKLMELMGGSITVDSIYTKGSVFTIQLEQRIVDNNPIGNTDELRNKGLVRAKYQQLFEAPEARVLVVDDNDMNRTVVQKLLKSTKLIVDVAKSGAECLQLTSQKYYHLILMDYMMPEMNGATTLMHIRKQEDGLCRETPVIVLTGDVMLQHNNVYSELGFDAFLEKPIRGEILEETILSFLPDEVIEFRQPQNSIENTVIKTTENSQFGKKQKKVCITTDCTCDISEELIEKYDISMVYLYVLLGEARFKDTREIDSTNMGLIDSGSMNFTAEAASIEDYESFFAERVTYAEDVIHISVGKNMGSSYANAVEASKGFGHVRVIDSGSLSCGMALIVLAAGEMAMAGATADEICEEIETIKRNIASEFLLPDANSFYEHGYTNKAIKDICSKLRMHPVLKTKQSEFSYSGIQFGNLTNCRSRFFKKYIKIRRRVSNKVIYITYAGVPVSEIESFMKDIYDCGIYDKVFLQKASVTNACFAGRGTIGVAVYLEK